MEKQMNIKRAFITLMVMMLLPGLAQALDPTYFDVDKFWKNSDGTSAGNNGNRTVDVRIQCNTGVPLVQTETITASAGVVFTVEELPDVPGTTCTVRENPAGLNGFNITYAPNGCNYEGGESPSLGAQNDCFITNQAKPGRFTARTSWITNGEGGAVEETNIKFQCTDAIVGGYSFGGTPPYYKDVFNVSGSTDTTIFVATKANGLTRCSATASVNDPDSVSASQGCASGLFIAPGDTSNVCTIRFTIFFEGIPTLNQYGMAILVLLMLGVGFVGFRRFV
jgi:hypothetical protein